MRGGGIVTLHQNLPRFPASLTRGLQWYTIAFPDNPEACPYDFISEFPCTVVGADDDYFVPHSAPHHIGKD